MTRQSTRALIVTCGIALSVWIALPAMAVNLEHLMRSLSHKQTVRLEQSVERLSRTGRAAGSPSLRVPTLTMADADVAQSELVVAASWDDATARQYGVTLASSARMHGINVLALPTRAFGENTFLAGHTAAAVVHGIQSGGVVAALFAQASGSGDERSLREENWAPLEYAIEAGNAGAVTCRLRNGPLSLLCRNHRKFASMVTQEAHFTGFGIDTRSSDLTSVDRILGTMSRVGLFKSSRSRSQSAMRVPVPASEAGRLMASGAVLLHDDANVLPLDTAVRSLVIVGGDDTMANAVRTMLPQATVTNASFADAATVTLAQAADASIIVLGATPDPNETGTIRAIGLSNPRTVLVVNRALSSDTVEPLAVLTSWQQTLASSIQPTPTPLPTPPPRGHHATAEPTPTPAPPPVNHPPAALFTWGMADAAPVELVRLLFGEISPAGHLPAEMGGYPLGTGLTYTTFSATGLKIAYGQKSASPVTVSFIVRNTGPRPGTTVEQLYLRFPAAAPGRGSRLTLVAYSRITLAPGRSKRLTMPLSVRSFAYWSTGYHAWFVAPGTYHAMVGTSEEDPQVTGEIHITAR